MALRGAQAAAEEVNLDRGWRTALQQRWRQREQLADGLARRRGQPNGSSALRSASAQRAGSGTLRTIIITARGWRMPEQFQLRGGFDQPLLQALRLAALERGGLIQLGYFLVQYAATLFQGFIRALSSGQRAPGGFQVLDLLRQKLLLRMLLSLRLPRLSEQARIVAVQLGQFVLFDDQGLLQLPQLQLKLLYLAFVPALILLSLILAGLAVVLQSIAGVLMFFLQRANLVVAIQYAHFLIEVGLRQASVLDVGLLAPLLLLMKRLLGGLELFREPAALTFQLLASALCLADAVQVVVAFVGQLLALLSHGCLSLFSELLCQVRHKVG